MNILVTGGAGFIGSHFLNYMVVKYPDIHFTCIDKLNYASHFCTDSITVGTRPNYTFVKADLAEDFDDILQLTTKTHFQYIFNFAAESCVDRSFDNPLFFTKNNVLATQNILECCRLAKERGKPINLIHISTDEVYGENISGKVTENSNLKPTNPYAATKAAIDLITQSYIYSYRLSVVVLRPNNVFGRNQYPEKIIPISIDSLQKGRKIPVHGDGHYRRTYLHVDDFNRAAELVWTKFDDCVGEIFNIGGFSDNEIDNLSLVKFICAYYMEKTLKEVDLETCIEYTKDRNYNDDRYDLDYKKIERLGWTPKVPLFEGLKRVIEETIEK